MKKEIDFMVGENEYHASVYIFEDSEDYDVTECYTFDEEGNSIDVNWKDFQEEIEEQIAEYLLSTPNGYYGGYDTWNEGYMNSL